MGLGVGKDCLGKRFLCVMRCVVYLMAAIAVLAVVAANMILTVNYNIAKINTEWEDKRVEYDNCFKAFDVADAQIDAVCNMWGEEFFTVDDICSYRLLRVVRYNILFNGNQFVDVIRRKNLLLCEMEERILTKILSI